MPLLSATIPLYLIMAVVALILLIPITYRFRIAGFYLLSGSRHVYNAAAELTNRFGETILAKCGYSRICGVVSAGAPEVLRTIRAKHNRMFLLVDGLDYPSGNAKNCSYAFDRFGYGAAVCAGPSVTSAWMDAESDGRDYVDCARQAAERMKKNLNRYVTIL